jgi:hypothetical protein
MRSWIFVSSTDLVKPKSAKDTVLDMARSLGLIVVILAVTLIFVPGLLHPSKSQRIQPVDYSDVVIGFKQVTNTLAEVPAGLPAAWKATSRSLTHEGAVAHLHVGFVAPDNNYAGLEEGTGDPRTFITATLGASGLTQTATLTVNGQTWTVRTSQRGETSLVRASHLLTVVITGSTSLTNQKALAASLHPSAQ